MLLTGLLLCAFIWRSGSDTPNGQSSTDQHVGHDLDTAIARNNKCAVQGRFALLASDRGDVGSARRHLDMAFDDIRVAQDRANLAKAELERFLQMRSGDVVLAAIFAFVKHRLVGIIEANRIVLHAYDTDLRAGAAIGKTEEDDEAYTAAEEIEEETHGTYLQLVLAEGALSAELHLCILGVGAESPKACLRRCQACFVNVPSLRNITAPEKLEGESTRIDGTAADLSQSSLSVRALSVFALCGPVLVFAFGRFAPQLWRGRRR
eukprot:CAMPEP_0117537842 /NCGR_PEP_ID=MMETSP0784-20121206/42176_1 /TAXON_ID=39447 /ORGANISM="" /LENGTH=263 /DNA_ID=CAMNT_0005334447 /DNA_START=93 /DNA_END=880 /DNA_ORIENTATION=+